MNLTPVPQSYDGDSLLHVIDAVNNPVFPFTDAPSIATSKFARTE